jgi:hypothetical protein
VEAGRQDFIQKIEQLRKSKVICYLTGDRPQFPTKVGEDVVPILYRHLEQIGEQENIDLFLYTRGGDMVVPIRIVKLIRNYCKKFSVLIPYRCHSAGTLICLGADEILMTKLAELTPVDPTSEAHPFNPKTPNPANPQQSIPLPVSVEDVRSYLAFAKEELKGDKGDMVDLYSRMTNQSYPNNTHLHPLALGNVYRVQKMIKIITKILLDLNFTTSSRKNDETISKIIKEITEDICVHNYPIYVDEAKGLGLTVLSPDKDLEQIIWTLFDLYSKEMKLLEQFNPVEEIGTNSVMMGNCFGAFIESSVGIDAFNFKYQIARPQPQAINFNIVKAQWEKLK